MHGKTVDASLETLDATREGLNSQEAARRRAEHSPNGMLDEPKRNPILRFLAHFHS